MRKDSHYLYIKNRTPRGIYVLKRRKVFKLFSYFLVGTGVSLLFYVILPILGWQLFYAPVLSSSNMLSPIPKVMVLRQNGISVLAETQEDIPFGTNLTYASNWFPTGNPNTGVHKEYKFSIPKLGIKNAKVLVGADDLAKSLIHYGGSSLPGEYGNAVVFGHSVLPQFFNPDNYNTLFSTLHTIKVGDSIEIVSDRVTYQYTVFDLSIIDPSDISVLEQTYDNSYLTVITCTPPGTYWKRLVVKARIENI